MWPACAVFGWHECWCALMGEFGKSRWQVMDFCSIKHMIPREILHRSNIIHSSQFITIHQSLTVFTDQLYSCTSHQSLYSHINCSSIHLTFVQQVIVRPDLNVAFKNHRFHTSRQLRSSSQWIESSQSVPKLPKKPSLIMTFTTCLLQHLICLICQPAIHQTSLEDTFTSGSQDVRIL